MTIQELLDHLRDDPSWRVHITRTPRDFVNLTFEWAFSKVRLDLLTTLPVAVTVGQAMIDHVNAEPRIAL